MSRIKNEVLIVLTEGWNDWEGSYAIAVINSFTEYKVKTISMDYSSKRSMGGINATIDYNFDDYISLDNLSMVILPGGLSWDKNEYGEIAEFIKKIMGLNIPVAGICGAASFLAKNGFLNNVKHTGESLEEYKKYEAYKGDALYISSQVIVDKGVITANETAAVEFAYEIFKILEIDSYEEMSIWYNNFKNGLFQR